MMYGSEPRKLYLNYTADILSESLSLVSLLPTYGVVRMSKALRYSS